MPSVLAFVLAVPACNTIQPAEPGSGDTPGAPADGRDGIDGLNCWDLDGNGVADPTEDVNLDGVVDALDCQGQPGESGQSGQDGLPGTAGSDGAPGVACWDLNANGLADQSEDSNGDGVVDAIDCRGPVGLPGSPGQPGPPGTVGPIGPIGPPGPEFFSVFTDQFYAADPAVPNELPFFLPRLDAPVFGSADAPAGAGSAKAVAFQVAVPETYDSANDVSLRLYLYRSGELDNESCLVLAAEALRLRRGSDVQAYGPRRWVRVDAFLYPGMVDAVLLTVDIPVNSAAGLDYPVDLEASDLLIFELSTFMEDGRLYGLLGVEFSESSTGTARADGTEVFTAPNEIHCQECDGGFPDCNSNGILDACDIERETSDDCNENGVPDECDICNDLVEFATGSTSAGTATPFTSLHSGFTQELYAVSTAFLGGLAFAPDGDVLVDACPGMAGNFAGSSLRRFDAQSTVLVNGSMIHPLTATLPSNAGCGLANHPDGSLYSNTGLGVTNLHSDTGAPLRDAFGPIGNSLAVAVDPQTGNVVYSASNGALLLVDVEDETDGVFSNATIGETIQGMEFDPTGAFLVCANRTRDALTILNRAGAVVRHVAVSHGGTAREPITVAFHGNEDFFVVSGNMDGSMTRFDFPDDNLANIPSQSSFAAGGFRTDMCQVGPDGCLYLTQVSTRYADGTVALNDRSIVRICGGFLPPPGFRRAMTLSPIAAARHVLTGTSLTATLIIDDAPAEGMEILFEVFQGPNEGVGGSDTTGTDGQATFTYSGSGGAGEDRIRATFASPGGATVSAEATVTWTFPACSLDCNSNGTPDECELAGNDCNANGILDECDGGCD